MKASSLPVTVPGAVQTLDEMLAESRGRYMEAINAALDEELQHFLLPDQQIALLEDAVLFLTFMATIKATEVFRKQPHLHELMRLYKPILAKLDKELPGMLFEFAQAHKQQAQADA